MFPPTPLPLCVIADDLRASRNLLESWTTECGFECDIASSAEEAWKSILSSIPQLVITDIDMPGASGLDLLCSIRSHPSVELRSIPVIVISSLEDWNVRNFVKDTGGTTFMPKPLEKESLQRLVRELRAQAWRTEAVNPTFQMELDELIDPIKKISPTLRRLYRDVKLHGPKFH